MDTHPFPLSKNVTIGCFGMDHCLQWDMSGHLGSGYGQPTDYDYAQLEGLAVSRLQYIKQLFPN